MVSEYIDRCEELLVNRGADVNVQVPYGNKYHDCNRIWLWQMCKKILQGGDDVNAANSYGFIALSIATLKDNHQCVMLLPNQGANVNAVE